MADTQSPVATAELGVRCEQCDTWFVVHIQQRRLADLCESICPRCGGAAFLITPEGTIEGSPLRLPLDVNQHGDD